MNKKSTADMKKKCHFVPPTEPIILVAERNTIQSDCHDNQIYAFTGFLKRKALLLNEAKLNAEM